MTQKPEIPGGVLLRDLIIFQLKLWLDGLKDVVLAPLSLIAIVFDYVLGPREGRGYRLYAVMRVGERFDLWLNLFGAVTDAEKSSEGLFGASAAGDDTLVGQLEQMAQRRAASASS